MCQHHRHRQERRLRHPGRGQRDLRALKGPQRSAFSCQPARNGLAPPGGLRRRRGDSLPLRRCPLPDPLLEIHLGHGSAAFLEVPAAWWDVFLGGSGIAARLLHDRLEPGRAPLDPAAPLLVVNGRLAGMPVPAACKASFCGISPLTGIWNEAVAGGRWAARLRCAGVEGLSITGRAPVLSVLLVEGGRATLLPAPELAGLDTFATWAWLRERFGERAEIACIGPAGERGVLLAGVMLDGPGARAAGRGGMGALMGSKNLKAIVVRGAAHPALADPDTLKRRVRADMGAIRARSGPLAALGTAGGIEGAEVIGALPVANWRGGAWTAGARITTAAAFFPRYDIRHHACWGCPMRCSKSLAVREGPFAGLAGHAPEYETIAGFGGNCLNPDVEVIIAANDACNRAGIDTISTSSAVAFAMEAAERGLLGPADAEGLSLAWGDGDTILGLVEQIAAGRALGGLLGQGTRRAAAALGPAAADLAPHVKGLELPFHDPRALHSMAISYATGNRGACHLSSMSYHVDRGIPIPELGYDGPASLCDSTGKAQVARDMQDFMAVFNPLGLCKFLIKAQVGPSHLAAWLRLATGLDLAEDELLRTGERIFQLQRLLNVRLGIGRPDDTLPRRFLAEPRPDGGAAGSLPDLAAMLDDFYALRGWDAAGRPTADTLARLGLDDLAEWGTVHG
ncbi:MAG: aldehyde ferredoxin oxidoreductase family protein [Pseudomonadota bacterium]